MLQPKKKPVPKKTKKSTNPADDYPPMKDKRGVPTIGGGEGRTPPFTREEMEYKKKMTGLPRGKMGKTVSKAKNGTSLGMKSVKAGFDKNPGVTRADIITAATKKAKKGATVKKAFLGSLLGGGAGKSMLGGIGKKMLGGLMGGGEKGGMLGGLLGKNGKSVKKAKSGSKIKKAQGGALTYTNPRGKQYSLPQGASGPLTITRPNGSTRTIENREKYTKKMKRVFDRNTVGGVRQGTMTDTRQKNGGVTKKAKSGASMKKCRYGCK